MPQDIRRILVEECLENNALTYFRPILRQSYGRPRGPLLRQAHWVPPPMALGQSPLLSEGI